MSVTRMAHKGLSPGAQASSPRASVARLRPRRGYSCAGGSPYQVVPGSPRMRAAPSRIEVTIDW